MTNEKLIKTVKKLSTSELATWLRSVVDEIELLEDSFDPLLKKQEKKHKLKRYKEALKQELQNRQMRMKGF